MPTNYCPYCGRFMQMREFTHACDQTNVLRNCKEWCNRCGAPLSVAANDDMDSATCHVCKSRIE